MEAAQAQMKDSAALDQDSTMKISTLRTQQIFSMHNRLAKMFEVDSAANTPPQSLDYTTGVLSPADRVKYLKLMEKLSKVKLVHLFAKPETSELHYFRLAMFNNMEDLVLEMVPPSLVVDLYALRDRLQSLEVVNSGVPDMAKALAKGLPDADRYFSKFHPMVRDSLVRGLIVYF